MARNRMIRPGFWDDEKVGMLSPRGRLAFIGLWTFADDNGVGYAHPSVLRGKIFPYDRTSDKSFKEILQKLADLRMIYLYEVEGQHYYQVVNFLKHQKINRPTPSHLPMFVPRKNSSSSQGGFTEDSRPKEEKRSKEKRSQPRERESEYACKLGLCLSERELEALIDHLGVLGADAAMKGLAEYVARYGDRLYNHYTAVLDWAQGKTDPYGAEEEL